MINWQTQGFRPWLRTVAFLTAFVFAFTSVKSVGGATSVVLDAAVVLQQLGTRVLVVEDDRDLTRLYQTVLRRWPMAPLVETSDNGIEALLAVERLKPDLLFIDLNIPGVDGFQMLNILNGKAGYEGMTAVVVSGLSAAEMAERGGVPPNILVLPKPISFDKLLAIATSVWAQKQGRQNTSAP